jgi:hypothetical protein
MPSFSLALPPIQEPPPPPRARDDEDRYATDRDKAADEAFDRALKEQLDRKPAPGLPPVVPIMPMMLPTPQVVLSEGDGGVAAAAAASVSSAFTARAVSTVSTAGVADRGQEQAAAATAPIERAEDGPATPIRLVVEAGLPQVQPGSEPNARHVPLADFPQVVVGHIRTSVQGNKPLTQLNFDISPPHVGPVNLQVSYTQGVVGVQLTALTMQAKQALDGQVGTIHQILTAHNLTPGQIRVVAGVGGRGGASGAGARGNEAGFGFFSGGRRRQPGAEDGTVTAT